MRFIKFSKNLDYIPDYSDVIDCFNDKNWNPSSLSKDYKYNVRLFAEIIRKNACTYLDVLDAVNKVEKNESL